MVDDIEYSRALITVLRGVVDKKEQLGIWNTIMENRPRIEEYMRQIGLILYVDTAAGYAYVRQDDNTELPRLVPRHQLSYGLSILLVQLRKALGDFDAANGDSVLVLSLEDIKLRLKAFYPAVTNETKFDNEVSRNVKRAVEMGFLSEIYGQTDTFEVRELIRNFVTADWLQKFNDRLQDYIDCSPVDDEDKDVMPLSL
ncbi:MAG: DUF4194 domain-containing protein [Anaerovibrio sp.]|uniref:DUF4194 domain-containing protein n=1 Tax=Anaerovibrio sp. TaxID=1872532 RepID=UPI0025F260CB|nr:DUF4194 domain-containing protein [Anaerovibrio sp.]MCR5176409.1 DUF4194 domain-containing protein [Anaerovibrio sp.]